jgi:N-dimethylarginine dimethylaminohydrolase
MSSVFTRDPQAFLAAWHALPNEPWGPAVARAAMLLAPEGLSSAAASCADNRYMDPALAVDAERAHGQHRALAQALSQQLPVWTFPGRATTPDACFLNNAFATVPGRLLLGSMRYPERQRETARSDIRGLFADVLGYQEVDLAASGEVAELTGSLIIDRQRGVGFHGLGERCSLAGAEAMHEAFGLRLSFAFALAPREYHTNVVMSVLAGRTLVLCRAGLADATAADALIAAYAGRCVELDVAEKNAFAGNCIALREDDAWLSRAAEAALKPATRAAFEAKGWRLRSVDLDEIEKGGGSLRCCVAEVF